MHAVGSNPADCPIFRHYFPLQAHSNFTSLLSQRDAWRHGSSKGFPASRCVLMDVAYSIVARRNATHPPGASLYLKLRPVQMSVTHLHVTGIASFFSVGAFPLLQPLHFACFHLFPDEKQEIYNGVTVGISRLPNCNRYFHCWEFTPAVYPRLDEFLHFDILSTGQKSHCVNTIPGLRNAMF